MAAETGPRLAGRLPLALLRELCAAGALIYQRLTDYFSAPLRRLDPRTEAYEPAQAEAFCREKAALYRKQRLPVGCVRAADLVPEGMEILFRMLEGDIIRQVTSDLYIMIGVDYEIYHTAEENLRKNCDLLDEAFSLDSKAPWAPKVYLAGTKETRRLASYARKCAAREGACIWARPLSRCLEVLVGGDWLACREDDRHDVYII